MTLPSVSDFRALKDSFKSLKEIEERIRDREGGKEIERDGGSEGEGEQVT